MALPCLQQPSGPQSLQKHLSAQSKQWLQRLPASCYAGRPRTLRKEMCPRCRQDRRVHKKREIQKSCWKPSEQRVVHKEGGKKSAGRQGRRRQLAKPRHNRKQLARRWCQRSGEPWSQPRRLCWPWCQRRWCRLPTTYRKQVPLTGAHGAGANPRGVNFRKLRSQLRLTTGCHRLQVMILTAPANLTSRRQNCYTLFRRPGKNGRRKKGAAKAAPAGASQNDSEAQRATNLRVAAAPIYRSADGADNIICTRGDDSSTLPSTHKISHFLWEAFLEQHGIPRIPNKNVKTR